jgi:hypothetical protein
MKKGRNILVGMLLGALAGGIVTFFFQRAVYHARVQKLDSIYKEYVDRVIFAEETSSISDDVVTLHALRLGRVTGLIDLKEQNLSSGIERLMSDYPTRALTDTSSLKFLKLAAKYDAAHPLHSGDTNTDEKVRAVLRSIPQTE